MEAPAARWFRKDGCLDLYAELRALVDALHDRNLDYAICGGVALAIHGHPRFTKDIDIVIQSRSLDAVRACVNELGFIHPASVLPFGRGTDQERLVYRMTKILGEETLTIDLLVLGPGFDEVWDNREFFAWNDRKIQVVSRDGLIKMKRLAARKQDEADIEALQDGDADAEA